MVCNDTLKPIAKPKKLTRFQNQCIIKSVLILTRGDFYISYSLSQNHIADFH